MVAAQGIERQRGMALVAVLGVLAVVTVMVAHLTMLGAVVQRESVVASELSRLKYVAESATGDAIWKYLVDRRLFASRALGRADAAREQSEWEPWMLDGRRHSMAEDDAVLVALTDATAGIDVSGDNPASELRDQLDETDGEDASEEDEILGAFLDVAADYVDKNDLQRPGYGKEQSDYEAEGIANFPRNGPMQFREEVYWLDGWQQALHDRVRIIPPKGVPVQRTRASKPPFFSSSPELIQRVLNLDEAELEQVLEARLAWREDGIPLSDSLAGDLLGKIVSSFSLAESGLATVEVLARSNFAGISRRVSTTLNCEFRRTDAFSDQRRQALALWDRRFF